MGSKKKGSKLKIIKKAEQKDGNGMAQAFHISSGTATAISFFIAFTALSLPFFMKSLGQGLALKTKVLSYITLLFGFYMAWNIGANDVANAMGTSVGSGALSLRQAAAVLEFSDALLMGTHVTSTMQKGILVANVFQGKDTLPFPGLLSSLAAAGTWLQPAGCILFRLPCLHHTLYSRIDGWFWSRLRGPGAVFWSSLARVTSSWVTSPVIGALTSLLVYKCIRSYVAPLRPPQREAEKRLTTPYRDYHPI